MLSLKNEKYILNTIKYGPIIFVLVFSFILTSIFFNQSKESLDLELKSLEDNYIEQNKQRVKNLVQRVYDQIELEKNLAYDELNTLLKTEITQAHSIMNAIYERNIQSQNYSKEKTIEEIKNALRSVRFSQNDGYLFIYTLDGINILNSEFPNIENKSLWDYKDAKGVLLIQEMNKILSKENETFYTWHWKKPKDKINEYHKIGFFKKFEPYDMFIGTGIYMEEFEKSIQKRITLKLNSMKFDNYEHIFLYTLDGICLVNPKKELVGKNRYNVKNAQGKYALRNTLETIKKEKETFIKYESTVKLNNELKSNSKISYIKLHEQWQWMIGSGFYLESLNNQIIDKQKAIENTNNIIIKNIIIVSFIVTILFIIVSFFLSKQLEKMFLQYKIQIQKEIKSSIEKEKLLVQQSKMATMGEMLSSIAHQWKQPLSLLSLSNGLIKISRETKDIFSEKEVDEAITNIDTAINNLNQTIEDFRNFFNPNKQRTLFKITDALDETLKLISSQLKNNNIEIIQNTNQDSLFGSQNELQQVLINILKNAKEELVKKDSKENRYIFIDEIKDEKNIIIKIKDNANGIPLNIIDKIFDSYFTTKKKSGGTGIGLYMSKQIIEKSMHGKILVSNVEYFYNDKNFKGAEFTLILPIDLREKKES